MICVSLVKSFSHSGSCGGSGLPSQNDQTRFPFFSHGQGGSGGHTTSTPADQNQFTRLDIRFRGVHRVKRFFDHNRSAAALRRQPDFDRPHAEQFIGDRRGRIARRIPIARQVERLAMQFGPFTRGGLDQSGESAGEWIRQRFDGFQTEAAIHPSDCGKHRGTKSRRSTQRGTGLLQPFNCPPQLTITGAICWSDNNQAGQFFGDRSHRFIQVDNAWFESSSGQFGRDSQRQFQPVFCNPDLRPAHRMPTQGRVEAGGRTS